MERTGLAGTGLCTSQNVKHLIQPVKKKLSHARGNQPTNQHVCIFWGGGGLFLADQTKPNQEFVAVGCALGGVAFGWLGVGDVPVDCVLIMCI